MPKKWIDKNNKNLCRCNKDNIDIKNIYNEKEAINEALVDNYNEELCETKYSRCFY